MPRLSYHAPYLPYLQLPSEPHTAIASEVRLHMVLAKDTALAVMAMIFCNA